MKRSTSGTAVPLATAVPHRLDPRRRHFLGLTQYLVGLPQLPDLAFQFIDPVALSTGRTISHPAGTFRLPNSDPHRLRECNQPFGKLPLSRPLGFHRNLDASARYNPRGCVSRLKTDLMPYSFPSPSSDVSLKISDKSWAVPSGS